MVAGRLSRHSVILCQRQYQHDFCGSVTFVSALHNQSKCRIHTLHRSSLSSVCRQRVSRRRPCPRPRPSSATTSTTVAGHSCTATAITERLPVTGSVTQLLGDSSTVSQTRASSTTTPHSSPDLYAGSLGRRQATYYSSTQPCSGQTIYTHARTGERSRLNAEGDCSSAMRQVSTASINMCCMTASDTPFADWIITVGVSTCSVHDEVVF